MPRVQRSTRFRVLAGIGIAVFLLVILAGSAVGYDAYRGSVAPVDTIVVESVRATPDAVYLDGGTAGSAFLYRAYDAEVVDGVMTVRLRYSLFGGGTGDFDLRVPTSGQRIEAVYLDDGDIRRRIYP